MRDDRAAEVTAEEPRQVETVLHQDRLIETVIFDQLRVSDRVDPALARHGLDRVAGNEPDQNEDQQRDSDEGRNHEAGTGEDEPEHAGRWSSRGCSTGALERHSLMSTP